MSRRRGTSPQRYRALEEFRAGLHRHDSAPSRKWNNAPAPHANTGIGQGRKARRKAWLARQEAAGE